MSFNSTCIPAEPEISGIGVRAAIYAQNLLSFIPAISALSDGEVAPYELEAVKDQSTTILITAFGILISAMVQAQTLGLPNFHANIILNLSWMNNTNTFIYFLLYVQHKSQLGPQQIKSDLTSWFTHIKNWISGRVTLGDGSEVLKDRADALESVETEPRSLLMAIFRVRVRGTVAILGSLHLSMMAALGLWLWSNPRAFGVAEDANACGMEFSSTIIMGKRIPLGSSALRIGSLLVYSAFLVPGLNLLLPMVFFLFLMQIYKAWVGPRRRKDFKSGRRSLLSAADRAAQEVRSGMSPKNLARRSLWALQIWYNPFLLPTVVAMVLLFAINLIFIVDTEVTLRQNRAFQAEGESDWTFGQTLAILLLVLPLRDLRLFGARRDVTGSLRNAVHWRAPTEILWDLVRRGADVNIQAEGSRYSTVLLLAVSLRRDGEFAKILLLSGANPDIQDSTDCTALQAAAAYGNLEIVNLLLGHGADPNIQGGEHGTALQAAAVSGNREIVQVLLDSGADVNIQGGKHGTALQAASSHGLAEIAELLRTHGGPRRRRRRNTDANSTALVKITS